MTQWAIQESTWGGYTALKIERETNHYFFARGVEYSGERLRRLDRRHFLDWRGDEAAAQDLAEKLKTAKIKCNRQKAEATSRFVACKAELIAKATKP